MKGLFTWLMILDVISIMSCFAYGTAKNYNAKDGWVIIAGGVVAINLLIVFCAYLA